MRSRSALQLLCVTSAVTILIGSALSGMGQGRKAYAERKSAKLGSPIRLRKIEGLERKGLVRTPVYQTSVRKSTGTLREWGRITVEYDTAREPEWIDELAMNFDVLLMTKNEDNNREFVLARGGVVFVDVKAGRDHRATMFLRPGTIERHGMVIGIRVVVSADGEPVAEESETSEPRLEKTAWWENDKLTAKDGLLLNRSESPFALINIDDHETIRR